MICGVQIETSIVCVLSVFYWICNLYCFVLINVTIYLSETKKGRLNTSRQQPGHHSQSLHDTNSTFQLGSQNYKVSMTTTLLLIVSLMEQRWVSKGILLTSKNIYPQQKNFFLNFQENKKVLSQIGWSKELKKDILQVHSQKILNSLLNYMYHLCLLLENQRLMNGEQYGMDHGKIAKH